MTIPDVEDGTQGAMQEALASVFANPDDLRRYQEAIANGATEKEALDVGDNGEGAWGDDTTSTTDPIVALPPDMPGVYHNRLVRVMGPKGEVIARIGDKAPDNGRIDLNPAAALAVGHPGGVVPVQWSFLNGSAPPIPNTSLRSSAPVSLMPSSRGAASAIPEVNLLDVANEDLSQNQPLMADNNAPSAGVYATDSVTGEPLVPASSVDQGDDGLTGTQDVGALHTNKILQTMQPPPPGTPGVVYNADRSVDWPGPGGTTLHRSDDGVVTYTQPPTQPATRFQQVKAGGKVFEIDPVTGKSKDVTPEGYVEPLHDAIMKQLADRQIAPVKPDGSQMNPVEAMQAITQYDKDAGKLTPYQQHEVDKVTQQANSSRSMYATQFVKMQPNYVSVYDNVTSKPLRQRSGMDDAFLISAAAGLENPGRATSGHDFELLGKTAGPSGQFEILGQRIKAVYGTLIDKAIAGDPEAQKELEGTRILSDAQVTQMMDNSRRAIKPRQAEYEVGQAKFRSRLEKAHVDPDDYLPDLKLPDEENASPTPTPTPDPNEKKVLGVPVSQAKAAFQQALAVRASKDATPEQQKKAQLVIDRLGSNLEGL